MSEQIVQASRWRIVACTRCCTDSPEASRSCSPAVRFPPCNTGIERDEHGA